MNIKVDPPHDGRRPSFVLAPSIGSAPGSAEVLWGRNATVNGEEVDVHSLLQIGLPDELVTDVMRWADYFFTFYYPGGDGWDATERDMREWLEAGDALLKRLQDVLRPWADVEGQYEFTDLRGWGFPIPRRPAVAFRDFERPSAS